MSNLLMNLSNFSGLREEISVNAEMLMNYYNF